MCIFRLFCPSSLLVLLYWSWVAVSWPKCMTTDWSVKQCSWVQHFVPISQGCTFWQQATETVPRTTAPRRYFFWYPFVFPRNTCLSSVFHLTTQWADEEQSRDITGSADEVNRHNVLLSQRKNNMRHLSPASYHGVKYTFMFDFLHKHLSMWCTFIIHKLNCAHYAYFADI